VPLFRVTCLAVVVLAACTDPPTDPSDGSGLSSLTCDGRPAATVHVETATESTRWTLAGSPHVVLRSIIGPLTIEPGVVACVGDVSFAPIGLTAIGTDSTPIALLPLDTAASWAGIRIPWEGGSADLTHVHIRRTSGPAIQLRNGTLRHVVADSACLGASCFAVSIDGYATVDIENPMIRWSGGGGIAVGRRSFVSVKGGRIEGSAAIGIAVPADVGGMPSVRIDQPIRITGGASYPAAVGLGTAIALTRDSASASGLTGNALDTLIVHALGGWGGDDWVGTREATIRKSLAWRIGTQCPGASAVLRLEPGASLALSGSGCTPFYLRLHVNGTASDPVTIRGGGSNVVTNGSDPAVIRHATLHDVLMVAQGTGPTTFEHVVLASSAVVLDAPGSAVADATIGGRIEELNDPTHRFLSGAAVTMGAETALVRTRVQGTDMHGVIVRGEGVLLTECAIARNAGDGLRVEQGSATISGCNLVDNGGAGVANLTGLPVSAESNWWGDAAGPAGPAGDGTSGAVDHEPARATPVAFGTGIGSVRILTPAPTVPTADAIQLSAAVYDANGVLRPGEVVEWDVADTAIARPAGTPGLIVGWRAGTTRVTARSVVVPDAFATVDLSVVPGAPWFEWESVPLSVQSFLTDLWGDAESGLTAAGLRGQILHNDGTGWRTLHDVDESLGHLHAIHGTTPSHIFAAVDSARVSRIYRFDGGVWHVDGTLPGFVRALHVTPQTVLAASDSGVFRRSATGWERIPGIINVRDVRVHGTDIFAATYFEPGNNTVRRSIMRWDGVAWRDTGAQPIALGSWSYALFGYDDRLLALNDHKAVRYHADGDWRPIAAVQPGLDRLSGWADDDLFGLGSGRLYHYDGRTWNRIFTGTDFDSRDVVWFSREEAFVLGPTSILHGIRDP
jgi:hypothetical protein